MVENPAENTGGFTKNEIALLVMILGLLESWGKSYVALQLGEKSAELVVSDFNQDALPLSIMITDLFGAYPDLIDMVEDVINEARTLASQQA